MSIQGTRAGAAALLLAAAALAGCGGSSGPGGNDVKGYITDVYTTVNGSSPLVMSPSVAKAPGAHPSVRPSFSSTPPTQIHASFHSGSAPSGSSGPAIGTSFESTPLVGQPLRTLVSGGTFDQIVISVSGVDGYWQLTLPSGVSSAEIVLAIAAAPPQTAFQLQAAGGVGSSFGARTTAQVTTADLSTADVAVILKWNAPTDVDLHVFDPNNTEIYYNNTSADGGSLNLDSNPACSIDNVDQEIVSWPTGQAPTGTYKVVPHWYADCGVTPVPWTLTIKVKGHSDQVYTGTFSGTSPVNGVEQTGTQQTFTFP